MSTRQPDVWEEIDVLDLSFRSYSALKRNNIHRIGQLLALTADEFLRMRMVGRQSLAELNDCLTRNGFAPLEQSTAQAAQRHAEVIGDLAIAEWIGQQLDIISTDHRAQPARSLLSTKREIPQVEKRRYAWRMFRWATGRTEKWPNMDEKGSAFEVYPLPGSVEVHLDGLNRLAHEELGDE